MVGLIRWDIRGMVGYWYQSMESFRWVWCNIVKLQVWWFIRYCDVWCRYARVWWVMYGGGMPGCSLVWYDMVGFAFGGVQVCRGVLWYGMIWCAGMVRYDMVVCRYAGVWTHTGPSLCVTSGTSLPHSSSVIHSLIHQSIRIQI